MLEWLLELDKNLFLWLNGLHHHWVDLVMWHVSGRFEWIPLYFILLGLVIREYRYQTWVILVGILLAIVAADFITSGIMKPYFERFRPSHDPDLAGMVRILNGKTGGLYGFASSHAANTFALATFFWMVFGKKFRTIKWLFVWALVVSYSRIYLGLHYPGDIFVGALVGIGTGWLSYAIAINAGKRVYGENFRHLTYS